MSKRTLYAAVVFLCAYSVPLRAQQSEKPDQTPNTKIERFLGTRGAVLRKDFFSLGSVRLIQFDALVLSEPGGTTKEKGLRVTVTEFLGGSLGSREHIGFLDFDEVTDLSKALAYMADLAGKMKAVAAPNAPYSEVVFSTKGDVRIGFYQEAGQKGNQKAYCDIGTIGRGQAFFDVQEITKVKEIVDRAIDLLKTK